MIRILTRDSGQISSLTSLCHSSSRPVPCKARRVADSTSLTYSASAAVCFRLLLRCSYFWTTSQNGRSFSCWIWGLVVGRFDPCHVFTAIPLIINCLFHGFV